MKKQIAFSLLLLLPLINVYGQCKAFSSSTFLVCSSAILPGLHDDFLLPDPVIDIEVRASFTVVSSLVDLRQVDVDVRNYFLTLPANTKIDAATSFQANGNHGISVVIGGQTYTLTDNGQPGTTGLDLLNLAIASGAWSTLGDAVSQVLSLFPVTLLSYTAEMTPRGAVLSWETLDETDNDYFLLESSPDGRRFEERTRISGNGTTSSLSHYKWTDTRSTTGRVYYRLSQFDFDGTHVILGVLSLDHKSSAEVVIGPNPVHGGETLMISGLSSDEPVNVELISMDGRASRSLNWNVGTGALIPADLPTGLYALRLHREGEAVTWMISVR